MTVEGMDVDVDLLDALCEGCEGGHRFDLDRIRMEAVCVFCGCVNEGILHGPKTEPRRGTVRGCMPWFGVGGGVLNDFCAGRGVLNDRP